MEFRKRLSTLGIPLITVAVLGGAAVLWTLGYKAQREAYYTDFLYRRLADIAEMMRERLKEVDLAVDGQLGTGWSGKDKVAKKVAAVDPNERSDDDTLLYFCGENDEETGLYTSIDYLSKEPPGEVWDDLIVSDREGRVLYQRSWEAQRYENVSFLLSDLKRSRGKGKESPEASDAAASSDKKEENSPLERKFRHFRQGIRLTTEKLKVRVDGKKGAEIKKSSASHELDLFVFGLVKQDRLENEVLALPYSKSIFFLFIALGVLFCTPTLRVLQLQPLQRLKRHQGTWLTVSTFLTVSLLTFGLLSLVFFRLELNRVVDEQLQHLTASLQAEVSQEFAEMRKALDQLTMSLCEHGCPSQPLREGNLADKQHGPSPFGEWALLGVDPFAWADEDGKQRAKFALSLYGEKAPPLIDVGDRPFFKAIAEGRGWQDAPTWSKETGPSKSTNSPAFFVDSVRSRTTGENTAILARPFEEIVPGNPNFTVATVASRAASLFDTFLPAGYGFAIVDPDSEIPTRVLFHSQSERNLHEWIYDDLLDREPLKAAIFAGSPQDFSTAYLGKDHHVHAQPFHPFAGSSWMLLVFSDKTYLRSALADVLTFAFGLYLVYTLVMIGILAWLVGSCDRTRGPGEPYLNPLAWLWPNHARFHGYYAWIAVLGAAAALYLAGVFLLPPAWLIGATVVIPLSALAAGYKAASSGTVIFLEGPLQRLSPQVRHTLAATLLLLLVAALPCAAYFRISFDYKMRQLARYDEVRFMKYLHERRERTLAAAKQFYSHTADQDAFVAAKQAREEAHMRGVYYRNLQIVWHPQEICEKHTGESFLDQWRPYFPGPYDTFGFESSGTAESDDSRVQWCPPAGGKERMQVAGLRENPVELNLTALSVPRLSDGWALTMGFGIPVLVFGWLHFLNRKMFTFQPVPSAIVESSGRSTIRLTDVHSPARIDWGNAAVVDLSDKNWYGWGHRLDPLKGGCVVLEHFERIVDDPVVVEAARLIERSRERLCLTISSGVDPVRHLEWNALAGDKDAAARLPKIEQALAGFERVRSADGRQL